VAGCGERLEVFSAGCLQLMLSPVFQFAIFWSLFRGACYAICETVYRWSFISEPGGRLGKCCRKNGQLSNEPWLAG